MRPFNSLFSNGGNSNPSQSDEVKKLVKQCIDYEAKGKIPELQETLFNLYSMFNKHGGGTLITSYEKKDDLALCFAFMLHYDWMNNNEIREVWAEDGFYCIIDYLDNQPNGRQGQAESMIILFTLLCVGRNSLKPKIKDILQKAQIRDPHIFHSDDYNIGVQNLIDQFSFLALNGVRDLGEKAIPVMSMICEKFNGKDFFVATAKRKDLMKYNPMDIINKARFIRDIIESILNNL